MANRASSKNEKTIPVELKNKEFTILLKQAENQETDGSSAVKRATLISFVFLVITYIFLLLIYVAPTNISPFQNISSNVGITYTAPEFLAVGDDNLIEFTLLNTDQVQTLNGTITLVFTDPAVSLVSTHDQRLSFQIKDLLPGDRITRQLKLKLAEKPTSNTIEFYFQFSSADGAKFDSEIDTFSVSLVPGIRNTWSWIVGTSGILALVIGFLFERIKTLLGFK